MVRTEFLIVDIMYNNIRIVTVRRIYGDCSLMMIIQRLVNLVRKLNYNEEVTVQVKLQRYEPLNGIYARSLL